MGGRGSRSGLQSPKAPTASAIPIPPQLQKAPPAPVMQPQAPQTDSQGFSDHDDADFHNLWNSSGYFRRQQFDIDTRNALTDYIDPNEVDDTVTGGTGMYSASQNMNWALTHGTMDAQQQYMYDSIVGGMHNLGYNLNLTRYDHGAALDDILASVAGYTGGHQGLSIATLKKMLVGSSYTDNRILSTTFNDFKNAQDPLTFNTREIKFTYRAKASTQALMPGVSSIPKKGSGMRRGDDLGEMLLAPTGNGHNTYKISDVRLSGARARRKGGSKYSLNIPQIEIVIDVE